MAESSELFPYSHKITAEATAIRSESLHTKGARSSTKLAVPLSQNTSTVSEASLWRLIVLLPHWPELQGSLDRQLFSLQTFPGRSVKEKGLGHWIS